MTEWGQNCVNRSWWKGGFPLLKGRLTINEKTMLESRK